MPVAVLSGCSWGALGCREAGRTAMCAERPADTAPLAGVSQTVWSGTGPGLGMALGECSLYE